MIDRRPIFPEELSKRKEQRERHFSRRKLNRCIKAINKELAEAEKDDQMYAIVSIPKSGYKEITELYESVGYHTRQAVGIRYRPIIGEPEIACEISWHEGRV